MTIKTVAICDVTSCSLVYRYKLFERKPCEPYNYITASSEDGRSINLQHTYVYLRPQGATRQIVHKKLRVRAVHRGRYWRVSTCSAEGL